MHQTSIVAATAIHASAGAAATATSLQDIAKAPAPKTTPSSTKAAVLRGWEMTRRGIMPGRGPWQESQEWIDSTVL